MKEYDRKIECECSDLEKILYFWFWVVAAASPPLLTRGGVNTL